MEAEFGQKTDIHDLHLPRAEYDVVVVHHNPPILEISAVIGVILLFVIFVYMMRRKIVTFVKQQPMITKRIIVLISVLWVIFETFVGFDIFSRRFELANDHDRNSYLLFTYVPLILVYGMYWVMMGMKKD
jgi:hypothetical protein